MLPTVTAGRLTVSITSSPPAPLPPVAGLGLPVGTGPSVSLSPPLVVAEGLAKTDGAIGGFFDICEDVVAVSVTLPSVVEERSTRTPKHDCQAELNMEIHIV